jgi:hypothetical protein
MKRAWYAAIAVVLVGFLGYRAESCGPFLESMLFTTYHGAPAGSFDKGRVGVLRPHFYRADLLMAYRTLSGVKLSAGETPAALQEGEPSSDRVKPWLDARAQYGAVPSLEPDKKVPGQDYQVYPNCLADAFTTAAATLRQREPKWGATSANLRQWIAGQDQVFENCAAGPSIPAELTSGDALLRADRRYQIAAARFYAGQYAESARAFDDIAKDTSSPWKDIAPYLAARAFVRQGTMQKDEAGLRQAATRLEAILKDPSRKPLQPAAQGMLDFVRAHLAPVDRLRELEKQLMQPNLGPKLPRIITDYTQIWDHLEHPPELKDSDLANWIEVFQSHGSAIEQWRTKRTTPWLIAALVAADAKEPVTKELIAASRAVPAGSPGWGSATYWGIRLSLLTGDIDGARQWSDQALAAKPDPAVTNLLRAERMKLARDWTEFLRFAPRVPVAVNTFEGAESTPTPDELKGRTIAFDGDAVQPLNERTPLALWIDAAKNDLVPRELQAPIARAAWVRAVLLDDTASAKTLASRVAQLSPELAGEMRTYLAATDAASARFAAIYLMLRAPGLEPVLRSGFGRGTPVMERDILRDNWWQVGDVKVDDHPRETDHDALADLYPTGPLGPTGFLPKDQLAAGEEEYRKLVDRAGNAVNFLAAEAIAWANAHPQDPRVPQALYQVVEATHYGPADGKKSREYSKQAFDILHRKYPNSDWTKKTKYWY